LELCSNFSEKLGYLSFVARSLHLQEIPRCQINFFVFVFFFFLFLVFLHDLVWCVGIVLHLLNIIFINIIKFEISLVTVTTSYCVVLIFLSFFGLPADTKSANIVGATVRNENMVEVSETDWAIVLVNLSLVNFLFGVS